jgi:hypothetical protein
MLAKETVTMKIKLELYKVCATGVLSADLDGQEEQQRGARNI